MEQGTTPGQRHEADLRAHVAAAGVRAIRAKGLGAVNYFDIAIAADLDVWRVKEAFPDWHELVVAVVDHWHGAARRQTYPVGASRGAEAFFRALLRLGETDPAMMRSRIHLLSAACEPEHRAGGGYRRQHAQLVEDAAVFLTRDVIAGREPASMVPRHAATQLVALYDGLQLQYLLGATTDLVGTWDRAAARMRAGWSAEYRERT